MSETRVSHLEDEIARLTRELAEVTTLWRQEELAAERHHAARLTAEAARDVALAKVKVLQLKADASLANNLCPDHRDKQKGRPCLACELDAARVSRDDWQRTMEETQRVAKRLERERDACLAQLAELKRGLTATNDDFQMAFLDAYLDHFRTLRHERDAAFALLRDVRADLELLIPVALTSELPATADVLSRIVARLDALLTPEETR